MGTERGGMKGKTQEEGNRKPLAYEKEVTGVTGQGEEEKRGN